MKSADAYEKAYRDGQQCYKQRVLEGKTLICRFSIPLQKTIKSEKQALETQRDFLGQGRWN